MKLLIIGALAVVCVFAEPPVENRYLPPQLGSAGARAASQIYGAPLQAYGAPSQTYGAPGFGLQKHTDAIIRGRHASRSQLRRPASQYGAPQRTPSSLYGAPSQQYGAPNGQLSQQFNAPSTQYGAPLTQLGASGAPSAQYGAPAVGLSQQYGAPGFGATGGQFLQGGSGSVNFAEQSRQYLPPGSRGYNGEDGNGEPANYSFEYMVRDEPSGNDFGHREARQGDRAEGLYYVVLPDGRKQTVEYEADQEGYKPRISYEDTASSFGGYGRSQAYQGEGPY